MVRLTYSSEHLGTTFTLRLATMAKSLRDTGPKRSEQKYVIAYFRQDLRDTSRTLSA